MAETNTQSNRLRRWHVAFGNPALGTYNGSIVTAHERHSCQDEESGESSSSSSCTSFSSCSSLEQVDENNDEVEMDLKENRTAVMTNVPPHQVPDGKLTFFCRIVIHNVLGFFATRSTQIANHNLSLFCFIQEYSI